MSLIVWGLWTSCLGGGGGGGTTLRGLGAEPPNFAGTRGSATIETRKNGKRMERT